MRWILLPLMLLFGPFFIAAALYGGVMLVGAIEGGGSVLALNMAMSILEGAVLALVGVAVCVSAIVVADAVEKAAPDQTQQQPPPSQHWHR